MSIIAENRYRAVVAGGSYGATSALRDLLAGLPADIRVPILIVLHMNRETEDILIESLQKHAHHPVALAEHGAPIEAGHIYVAPAQYHLMVEEGDFIALSADLPENFSMPSIDVLFEAAANVYGTELIGVLLSGNNGDGSRGLKYIHDLGGLTLLQDPKEATGPIMPELALKACSDHNVLCVSKIAEKLRRLSYDT